ncbi:Potassium channel subfamily K member 4 [Holothuria leucospilota]|uniref:Potassium channel subfamily K member 4 n=1 Tax=Holothuria leucospilota TaxID=206669 RepID=A0A9Q1HGK9_HOLLE|nr:Potassium channel subfamily K member 4 [Holothuria leucospilota]
MRKVSSGVQLQLKAKKRTLKRKIRNWHKSIILFVVLLIYLVFGAVIFSAIEKDVQLEAQLEFNQYSAQFLEDHESCLNMSDFREYVELILDAMKKGAVLQKGFQTTTPEDSVEHLWNLPNAFFFSSTVVTTIGYGNLAPYTTLGRIICIFYALIGIPMTGWMLSCIGQTFHDKWHSVSKLLRKFTHRFKSTFINNVIHILVVFLIAYSTIIVIPAIIISYNEGWYYIDSHYFCFISLTTIGFGDLAPMAWTDNTNIVRQWIHTILYVTYLLLGLSLLSVALTAFLKKHEGQFKTAGKRMRKFVTDSARSATVRVKEAAERGYSPSNTPDNSFKQRDMPDNSLGSTEPKLLGVTYTDPDQLSTYTQIEKSALESANKEVAAANGTGEKSTSHRTLPDDVPVWKLSEG